MSSIDLKALEFPIYECEELVTFKYVKSPKFVNTLPILTINKDSRTAILLSLIRIVGMQLSHRY